MKKVHTKISFSSFSRLFKMLNFNGILISWFMPKLAKPSILGFLNTFTFRWDNSFLGRAVSQLHRIPGIYPTDAKNSFPTAVTIRNVQTLSDVLWGSETLPQLRTAGLLLPKITFLPVKITAVLPKLIFFSFSGFSYRIPRELQLGDQ